MSDHRIYTSGDPMDITDIVAHVFDLAIQSMDFGSGFLHDEDVINLRRLARYLGRDPADATPWAWTGVSGAVRVENDHATQLLHDWNRGVSGSRVANVRAQCLCGWEGTKWDFPTSPANAKERQVFETSTSQASADGDAHIAEMLDQAREGGDG